MAQGVILSTGDIKAEYEIVDIVFAVQVVRSHFVRSGGRETLEFLPQVNDKLREAASGKGCDGVIYLDYDFARDNDVQVITAYGTGVKLKQQT